MKKLNSLFIITAMVLSMLCGFASASASEITAQLNSVTDNVYVEGKFDDGEYKIGDCVTAIMKKGDNADDIQYVSQSRINSDGTYSAKFRIDSTINVSDYIWLIRAGDTIVNTPLTIRTESLYKADIELVDENGGILNMLNDSKASVKFDIKNYFDDETKFKGIISFYGSDDKLLGVKTEDITAAYNDCEVRMEGVDIPEGTVYAKGMLWSSFSVMTAIGSADKNSTDDYDKDAYLFCFGDSLGHVQKDGGVQQGWSYYCKDFVNLDPSHIYYNCYSGWTMRDALVSSWPQSYKSSVPEMERIKQENPNAKIYAIINMGTNDYFWKDGFVLYDDYKNNLKRLYNGYGVITDETYDYRGDTVTNNYRPIDLADAQNCEITVKGLKDFDADLILITPASNVKTAAENAHVNNAGKKMREAAYEDKTDGIYCADIYTPSYDLFYNKLGMEKARETYTKSVTWYKEFYGDGGTVENVDGIGNKVYKIGENSYQTDYLHYNPKGAEYVAELIFGAIKDTDSNLKYYIK